VFSFCFQPRGEDDLARRKQLCGFVSFMKREDAEIAMRSVPESHRTAPAVCGLGLVVAVVGFFAAYEDRYPMLMQCDVVVYFCSFLQ
jgi:hypothetical protein